MRKCSKRNFKQQRIELVVASRNQKKVKEIKEILKELNLKITSLRDYPGAPYIIEALLILLKTVKPSGKTPKKKPRR
jgi:signal recognition particle subunit SEC65